MPGLEERSVREPAFSANQYSKLTMALVRSVEWALLAGVSSIPALEVVFAAASSTLSQPAATHPVILPFASA